MEVTLLGGPQLPPSPVACPPELLGRSHGQQTQCRQRPRPSWRPHGDRGGHIPWHEGGHLMTSARIGVRSVVDDGRMPRADLKQQRSWAAPRPYSRVLQARRLTVVDVGQLRRARPVAAIPALDAPTIRSSLAPPVQIVELAIAQMVSAHVHAPRAAAKKDDAPARYGWCASSAAIDPGTNAPPPALRCSRSERSGRRRGGRCRRSPVRWLRQPLPTRSGPTRRFAAIRMLHGAAERGQSLLRLPRAPQPPRYRYPVFVEQLPLLRAARPLDVGSGSTTHAPTWRR